VAACRSYADALHACRATIIISGYGNPLYDEELYNAWYHYTLEASTSQGGHWESRTEVLWSNRPLK
jgi:DNA adenine methylase